MRLLRLFAHGDIAERSGSHVVCLAFADERVVFDQELDFRIVCVGVLAEDLLCLAAVILLAYIAITGQGGAVLGYIFEFHIGFQGFAGCFGELLAV